MTLDELVGMVNKLQGLDARIKHLTIDKDQAWRWYLTLNKRDLTIETVKATTQEVLVDLTQYGIDWVVSVPMAEILEHIESTSTDQLAHYADVNDQLYQAECERDDVAKILRDNLK